VPWANKNKREGLLVSETGVELARPVAFKFALDLTAEQSQGLFMCAGARRFAYNHHIGRVKDSLSARAAQRQAGTPKDQMNPALVVVSGELHQRVQRLEDRPARLLPLG